MKLTKTQRAALREKFGGRCAYCGTQLGEHWHADHFEAVMRESKHVTGKGFVLTGQLYRPEHDNMDNMMPACAPCNIDKHSMSLECWRVKLSQTLGVLQRNSPTYRHALRFRLIEERSAPIVFYFEHHGGQAQASNKEGDNT